MSQFPPTGPGGFAPGPPNPYAAPATPGQPMPPGTVKNWLVESIISLVCCCWPLAIPALVYASQVNGKLAAGDYQGAVEASNNAKKWLIITVCVGAVCQCMNGIGVLISITAQNH